MTDKPNLATLTFKKDAYIIVEGKLDECFFIIKQGKVQLSREAEVVKERDGNILNPGDFFGVIAAMSSHGHIETAQALTDVVLTVVEKNQFDGFIQHNIPMAKNIIMQFSNRIRYLTKSLTQLTLDDNTEAEDASDLFAVGKYYDKVENFSHAYYAYRQYLKYCPEGEHAAEAKERLEAVASYAKPVPFTTDGNRRVYGKDTVLYIQGEPGEELYVIQSGSIKITKIINGHEILLGVRKTGDIVGEMSIIESKPRSVTAVTHEDCTIIAIGRESFETIVNSNPQIIGHLIQLVAERIWFLYKQLSNTLLVDPVARLYDAMLIQLEKERVPLDSSEGYRFNFGLKDLVATTGISEDEADKAVERMKADLNIQFADDAINILQVAAVTKQGEYYRSIEWRKKTFREKQEKERITITNPFGKDLAL